jgi:DNA-binding XRE family transcriptional regulator
MLSTSSIERVAWIRALVKNGGARAIREAAGVSAAELARSIDASPAAVSLWERGLRYPREATALRYAAVLEGLSVHSRLRHRRDPAPPMREAGCPASKPLADTDVDGHGTA